MVDKYQKPSIAIFLNSFWTYHNKGISGGDQMAMQIFSRIKDPFSDVKWFTCVDGQKRIEEVTTNANFSITSFWFDKLPLGLNYILRTIHATLSLFTMHPDIIYSGSDFFPDVLPAYLYTRIYRKTQWIQCIFHIYPHWRSRPGNKIVNFSAEWLQRISLYLARKSHAIVNINEEVREILISKHFNAEMISIITPGVDLAYIDAVLPNHDAQAYDAVFLGRLAPSKGIYDLPLIWRTIIEQHPNARLAIIGSGSKSVTDKLVSDLNESNLQKNVDLLGYIDSKEIYSIIKKARSFIFPSYEEGFGIAIVEAMACKTPVIAWKLPVYKKLFGDAIQTIEKGDLHEFSKAILDLMDKHNKHNTEASSKGYLLAKQYSWQRVSNEMKRLLLRIYTS